MLFSTSWGKKETKECGCWIVLLYKKLPSSFSCTRNCQAVSKVSVYSCHPTGPHPRVTGDRAFPSVASESSPELPAVGEESGGSGGHTVMFLCSTLLFPRDIRCGHLFLRLCSGVNYLFRSFPRF